ncbi:MAG: SMI1/KNR4 family protein [Sphingomonas bacterium]
MNLLFGEFTLSEPADVALIEAAEKEFGFNFPDDYKAFMAQHGGGEGFVGEHYLILWGATELSAFNQEYEFPVYAPALVAFGSDGGGEAFAFDTRASPPPIVMVPFIGMSNDDAIRVADSFDALLTRMQTAESLFDAD